MGLSTPIGVFLVRVFYLPRFTFVVLTQKSKQKKSRLLIFSEQNLRFAIGRANRTRPEKGAQTGSLSLSHRFMAALVLWSENLRGRSYFFDTKYHTSKQNKVLQYKLMQRRPAEMAGLALG